MILDIFTSNDAQHNKISRKILLSLCEINFVEHLVCTSHQVSISLKLNVQNFTQTIYRIVDMHTSQAILFYDQFHTQSK